MRKEEAIGHLQELIERVPALQARPSDSESFQKWRSDSRIVLARLFPSNPEPLKEFEGVRYSPSMYTTGTPDSYFDEYRSEGLGRARAILEARRDELDKFWENEAVSQSEAAPTPPSNPDSVFVIHGRQKLGDFHAFLRALGIKPLEWSAARRLTGVPTPFTWQIVDAALSNAGAIVALLTTDDEARLKEEHWSANESVLEKELMGQPRQNVLFEAGVIYGRKPERTVLIRVGNHRPMSDLAGHHILTLDSSPQARHAVADALEAAGCRVDRTGTDWLTAGDFS